MARQTRNEYTDKTRRRKVKQQRKLMSEVRLLKGLQKGRRFFFNLTQT